VSDIVQDAGATPEAQDTYYPTGPGGTFSPVPPTFNRNELFIDGTDGSQWEYNPDPAVKGWVRVGHPFTAR
jgi:hypothetical protein